MTCVTCWWQKDRGQVVIPGKCKIIITNQTTDIARQSTGLGTNTTVISRRCVTLSPLALTPISKIAKKKKKMTSRILLNI